jgi:hypothetical protein
MTDLTDEVLTIRNLRDLLGEARTRNIELARINADLERHNRELRQAVDALLQPAASELLAKNREEAVRRGNLDKAEHDGT